ncbi:MAG: adenylate/guanylate cyclase domain-containing protein, partial [Candidatus Eremiobacterota bacterium]
MQPVFFRYVQQEERCALVGPAGTFPLEGARVTVGSHPDNAVVVSAEGVAPRHARFDRTAAGVYLLDMGTPTGTFLNGRRITRALLRNGDQIGLGAPVGGSKGESVSVEFCNRSVPISRAQRPELLADPDKALRHGSSRTKMEVLLAVATELSRPRRLEERLDEILRIMLEIMEFDRAAIRVLEPDCTEAPWRFTCQAFRTRYGQSAEEEVLLSSTIIHRVLSQVEGLQIKDALFHQEFGNARSVQSQEIRTCVCFPLKTAQNLLGVLYADAQSPIERVSDEDMAFVSAFAAHAAVAVENTLLYERLQQQAVVRSRLERFLPSSAVDELVRRPEAARVGGEEREVTVLFCDIRNYTMLSQERPPWAVAAMLSEYFPEMVRIVFAHGGTLEKYIGDALMAVWGAPLALDPREQVEQALEAAVEMQRSVAVLNRRWGIDVGIGINTGRAFVGNIGDEDYLQYAAIGAATNLAARLCSEAGPGEIVLSRSSRE